ncbi:LacI family DNA-binding transcriptional regulator [Butyricicoccus sp.]|uniref:LacI family DNA-binding transcriptional regulator n=1 Tax=Butyricicoccus sp. TaxID=2049021 RepID=UPI003736E8F0
MAVTLKMLAEHTGFSPATISRVLNNDPSMSVSEETRRIIFDTAKKLGYAGGSGRRTQRIVTDTMTIGIAEMLSPAEQMTDPYFLYLKNFVEQTCNERKVQTVMLRADADGYHALSSSDIDGIIAIGYFSDAQIASMQLLSNNITFLDSSPDELRHDSVVLNFELGMKQALDYLRELGHSRIGFIGPKRLGDETKRIVREPRRRYYEHYMRERGLFHSDLVIEAPMRDRMIAENEFSMRLRTMEQDMLPTAVVTVNEECAIGAIHALRNMQIQVPSDISIVSFNDTVMSSVVEPPLTSVSPHLDYMAATAVQLVMQRASTPAHQPERRYPQKIVIPPALVRRGSTAPYVEKK